MIPVREAQAESVQQRPVSLPGGAMSPLIENGPIVIVGPNGSGKTRRSRAIQSDVAVEIVSALRNTRISPQLQPTALSQAKQNFYNQKESARSQPYELTNDFDFMMTALIGETLEPALAYLRARRAGNNPVMPKLTSLEKVQDLWAEIFPGRELTFEDYTPRVINFNAVGDEPAQYSAWEMSDGEKATLYLAGRVFSADDRAVLLIDEPETHLHSLLAVHFWDALEQARPDIRFLYVTHDMTFAASRHAVQYLLANPKQGLTPVDLGSDSGDLAAVLLGTASLSFYASEIVFCEGDAEALDARLYGAWFNDKKTVVQPVGSCDQVMRSVSALDSSSLVQNLKVHGIIDRDFCSQDRLAMLPQGVVALPVHEVETLYALPDVVEVVAKHVGQTFDKKVYTDKIIEAYDDADRHAVVLERWKVQMERSLSMVVSSVSSKNATLEDITKDIPSLFDQAKWSFSPQTTLADEKQRVEQPFTVTPPDLAGILAIMPGKKLRGLLPNATGLRLSAYDDLVIAALKGKSGLEALGQSIRNALVPYMPLQP